MLTGACHCGAVRVTIPRKPRAVTDCNCSICRRYGVLWAYYKLPTVSVEAKRGATEVIFVGPQKAEVCPLQEVRLRRRLAADQAHRQELDGRQLPQFPHWTC